MNTLSSRFAKSVSFAVATVALAAPFATQAHDYAAAMDSCIDAFVASSVPKAHPVKVRKDGGVNNPLSAHARSYKIVVTAKGMESGKYVARGTCIIDSSGAVVELNGKPLTQKLAAR